MNFKPFMEMWEFPKLKSKSFSPIYDEIIDQLSVPQKEQLITECLNDFLQENEKLWLNTKNTELKAIAEMCLKEVKSWIYNKSVNSEKVKQCVANSRVAQTETDEDYHMKHSIHNISLCLQDIVNKNINSDSLGHCASANLIDPVEKIREYGGLLINYFSPRQLTKNKISEDFISGLISSLENNDPQGLKTFLVDYAAQFEIDIENIVAYTKEMYKKFRYTGISSLINKMLKHKKEYISWLRNYFLG